MIKYRLSLSVVFCVVIFNVDASDLILECTTKNHNQFKLYQDGRGIKYVYGKAGSKPEIELRRMIDELNIETEQPIGTGLNSSLEFKNGSYSYVITESLNRVSEEHEATIWLDVNKNNKTIETMDCIDGYGSISDINY